MTEPSDNPKPAGKFLRMASLDDVDALFDERITALTGERVALIDAGGRVLSQNIVSRFAIPPFDRAAMDGYAVRSVDLAAASSAAPIRLNVAGQALPNRPFAGDVPTRHAVRIATGAPIPLGCDAVVMQEDVSLVGNQVQFALPTSAGKHVGRRGEDIASGDVVLRAGRVLRPQDQGVLASIGVADVAVVRRPSVSILVTGNEVLPCGAEPEGFRIVDSISVMLRSLVSRDGGYVQSVLYLRDDEAKIEAALKQCDADLIIVTGGTSVGVEDFAPRVVQRIGELVIHGVRARPARPIGIGFLNDRPICLLPGNPFSCLCAYDLVIRKAVQHLAGRPIQLPYSIRRLPLGAPVLSAEDRVDCVRVEIRDALAFPIQSRGGTGASVFSSASRADGFIIVPPEQSQLSVDELVDIYLYC